MAAKNTNNPDQSSAPWYASTFAIAMLGSVVLYVAFPPLDWWPLAWIAPVPWLLLVRAERMPSSRPYRWLYLAGLLHWLILVQWIRLGHWAAHFGWIAGCLYLACYLPVLVWLSRVATRRLRAPLVIAAPLIWVGLECLRGWLLTGFSMALLAHTQIHWLSVMQVSDLAGAYLVSFLMIFVASAIAQAIPLRRIFPTENAEPSSIARRLRKPSTWIPLTSAAVLLIATLVYGNYRLQQTPPETVNANPKRIALIQGSIDTVFDDPSLNERMFKEYRELTFQALHQQPAAIIWPESVLPLNWIEVDRSGPVQKGRWLPQDDRQFEEDIAAADRGFRSWAAALGQLPEQRSHVPLLLGTTTLRLGDHPPQRCNSAIFVNEQGQVAGGYDKLHPVMFGEYAPFGNWFPAIYHLMPIPAGLTPGDAPQAFDVAGLKMCPSICYENTVPHLIRRQVVQLQAAGVDPDVLVTLSNDGWFHGSAELDMHLVCGQFRAIELRKPALVAANTGLSAHIADDGRLLREGPRQQKEVIIAEVTPAWRGSLYTRTGDVFANGCLLFCFVVAICGVALAVASRRRKNKAATSGRASQS